MPDKPSTMRGHAETVLAHQEKLKADATDPILPSEADLLEEAAAQAEAQAAATDAQAQDVLQTDDALPVSVRTALTCANFQPDSKWATRETLDKPRGYHVELGRVMGVITATETKHTPYEGKVLESVALIGTFTARCDLRGEVIQARNFYAPMAFAGQMREALADAQRTDPAAQLTIDVDIGIDATGKQIPFGYTITHYIQGFASRAVRDIIKPRRLTGARLALARPEGSDVGGQSAA